MPNSLKPTPRQVGYVIGGAIEHMPIRQLSGAADQSVFAAAGVSKDRLFRELLLLMAAAAIHAIKTAGLAPEYENEVAEGLYDWLRQQPDGVGAFLTANIEDAVDSYAQAAKQDRDSPPRPGDFSELELSLVDRLMALGEDNERRARACVELGIVAPKTLWPVQYASTVQILRDACLVSTQ